MHIFRWRVMSGQPCTHPLDHAWSKSYRRTGWNYPPPPPASFAGGLGDIRNYLLCWLYMTLCTEQNSVVILIPIKITILWIIYMYIKTPFLTSSLAKGFWSAPLRSGADQKPLASEDAFLNNTGQWSMKWNLKNKTSSHLHLFIDMSREWEVWF